jgi:acyl-CoA thioesterase
MTIADELTRLAVNAGPQHLQSFENWLQGRTLYGGASALIAYCGAMSLASDLPPLRSAQVTFVGPPGEEIEVKAEMVRRGRSVAQVRVDLLCEGAVVLSSIWLFGTAREPNARYAAPAAPEGIGQPGDSDPLMQGTGPSFMRHFDLRRAQETRGPGEPVVRRWVRFAGKAGLDPVQELVLMGDVLPPGSMRAMQRQGPISSINWQFNLLGSPSPPPDGWWLAETKGEWAGEGYSSERLRMWNSTGELVMSGLQSVAVFG